MLSLQNIAVFDVYDFSKNVCFARFQNITLFYRFLFSYLKFLFVRIIDIFSSNIKVYNHWVVKISYIELKMSWLLNVTWCWVFRSLFFSHSKKHIFFLLITRSIFIFIISFCRFLFVRNIINFLSKRSIQSFMNADVYIN